MRYLLILLLAGCGGGNETMQAVDNNNHGYGFQFDVQGAAGLKLRGGPDASVFENDFAATQQCAGLNAPDPFVILIPKDTLGTDPATGLPYIGRYLNKPSLILLEPKGSMQHESIHYLLDVNTGDLDPGHLSPLFKKCS